MYRLKIYKIIDQIYTYISNDNKSAIAIEKWAKDVAEEN